MLEFSNIKYISIKEFILKKEEGEHTFLFFKLFIEDDKFTQYISILDENIEVKYYNEIIFNGYIAGVELEKIRNNSFLTIKAYSFSKREDIETYTRVYQSTKKTYKDILKNVKLSSIKGMILDSAIENKVVDYPILQFEETNYQFLKRIFYNEKQNLVNDDISSNQKIFFGKRENLTHNIKNSKNFSIKKELNNKIVSITLPYRVEFSVGDFIKIEKKKYWIIKIKIEFKHGILFSEIGAVESTYKVKKIDQDIFPKLFKAKVVVNKDEKNRGRIQVKFNDIEDVDQDNRYWFSVNTPYSTNDVGFFFIPALNDKVFISFSDYKLFFVITGIRENSNQLFSNPQEQYIRNEFKKEFNLKEKELNLISHDEISLKMTEEFIELKNGKSLIRMEKDNIIIKVLDSIIKIDEDMKLKTGKFDLKSKQTTSIKAGGDVIIKGSKVKIN